jgi:hypothetical protein
MVKETIISLYTGLIALEWVIWGFIIPLFTGVARDALMELLRTPGTCFQNNLSDGPLRKFENNIIHYFQMCDCITYNAFVFVAFTTIYMVLEMIYVIPKGQVRHLKDNWFLIVLIVLHCGINIYVSYIFYSTRGDNKGLKYYFTYHSCAVVLFTILNIFSLIQIKKYAFAISSFIMVLGYLGTILFAGEKYKPTYSLARLKGKQISK